MEIGVASLFGQFDAAWAAIEQMIRPLRDWEYRMQASEEVSPPKWLLGHVAWVTARYLEPVGLESGGDERRYWFFNSYYVSFGERWPRGERHRIPIGLEEIHRYRAHVRELVHQLIRANAGEHRPDLEHALRVVTEHIWQHHELFHCEVLANRWSVRHWQPFVTLPDAEVREVQPVGLDFLRFDGGEFTIGAAGDGWAWDIERPVHPQLLQPFELANRTVTNREFLAFVRAGGYDAEQLWSAAGWAERQAHGWKAPAYWKFDGDSVKEWTLLGWRALDGERPVCHVSWYEADAYARWLSRTPGWFDVRLPTEAEWEVAARATVQTRVNFHGTGIFSPISAEDEPGLQHLFGNVWEWTSTRFQTYPGYRAPGGPYAEYNGNFADGSQVVSRGGSCVTSMHTVRPSTRNFWLPGQPSRFAFNGIRLARDA